MNSINLGLAVLAMEEVLSEGYFLVQDGRDHLTMDHLVLPELFMEEEIQGLYVGHPDEWKEWIDYQFDNDVDCQFDNDDIPF